MEKFSILILIALGFLMVFSLALAVYFFRFKKRLDLFFKKGEEDLEKLLLKQVERLEKQEKEIQKTFEEIGRLKDISQRSFQKIGLIRFNPFKDIGSDQSFSIALLDLDNNGFVITSLYSREGNRIYAKPINKGESKYTLSNEEKEAIQRAIGA